MKKLINQTGLACPHLSRKITYLMMLLVSLIWSTGTAWADTTLFTTNFSTADGWSASTDMSGSGSIVINGTTISYKAGGIVVATSESGTLIFGSTNLGSTTTASSQNNFIAIPLTGVNGSITITYTGDKRSCYYTCDDGNIGTLNARTTAGNNNERTWTISDLTNSNVTLYLGTGGQNLTSLTITTPSGGSPSPVDPIVTFNNGAYTVGGSALNLSTLFTSNSSGAVTYTVTNANGTGATVAGTNFTATTAGTATVTASQAAVSGYNAKAVDATITVNAAAPSSTLTPISSAKTWIFNTAGGWSSKDYSATEVVDNLELVVASDKLTADGSKLKLNGTGSTTSRAVHFKLAAGNTYTVTTTLGGSATRTLIINDGTASDYGTTDGTQHSTSKVFDCTSAAKDIYIYSGGSGIDLYSIAITVGGEVDPEPEERDLVKWDKTYSEQGLAGFTTEPTIPESGTFTFQPNVRYSKLLIDKLAYDFRESTTDKNVGLMMYSDGNYTTHSDNRTKLHYVPGFVAKAVIEAVDYYRTSDLFDVKPWYMSVKKYGIDHEIQDKAKNGGNLDDLNAVKIYSLLRQFNKENTFNDNDASLKTAVDNRFADALQALRYTEAGTIYGSAIKTKINVSDCDANGGWYHKATDNNAAINSMWCDGQYMGPALLAQIINDAPQYSKIATSATDDWDLITNQLEITWKHLWDNDKKLLYHGFSADPTSSNHVGWATRAISTINNSLQNDNICKTNTEFWGRANGWYIMALVDVIHQMDRAGLGSSANATKLKGYLSQLAAGIVARQDEGTGCWYQLVGHDGAYSATGNGKTVDNFIESSASALFLASIMKAQRLGYISGYTDAIKKGYKGFIEHFLVGTGDNNIRIIKTSCSASLNSGVTPAKNGDAEYYLTSDDAGKITDVTGSYQYTEGKALGAFIMAAVEYERLYLEDVVKQDITRLSPKGGTNTTKIAVNQTVNPYLFIAPFTSDKKILTVDDFEITSTDNSIVTGAIRNNTIYNDIENNDCRHLVLNVTGVAVGSATITVHFKGNAEYNPYDWSCVYTVAETHTVASTNDGNGTVKITSKDAEVTSVLDGTQVTYTAIPNDGYIFAGWVDNSTEKYLPEHANDNPLTITVTANTSLKANFIAAKTFNVAYATGSDSEMGSIAIYERNTNTPNLNGVAVPENMNLDFVANPSNGYKFVGWYSDAACETLVSSDVKFLKKAQDIATNTTYYAKFEQKATETLFNLVVSSETTETVTADTPIDITLDTFASTLEGGTATAGTLSGSYEAVNANDYLKFGANAQYVKIDLTKPLAAGDVIEFTSYGGNNKQLTFTTDNKRATANLTSDGKYIVPAGSNLVGATTLYVWRAESSTTYVSSLKITRPEVTLDAVIKIDNIIQAKTETSGDGSSESSRETYEYEVPGDYEGATVPVAIATSGTVSESITSLPTPHHGTPTVKEFTITAGETVKYFRITLTRGMSSKSEILGATINGTAAVINENTISQVIPYGGATEVPVSLTLPEGATASPNVPFNMTLGAEAGAIASQTVTVTAQDGVSQTVYTVNLTRGKNDVLMVTYDGQEYMLLKENAYKTDGTTKYVEGSETAAAYFQATNNWSSVTIDNQSLYLMNQSESGRYLTLNTNGALSFEVITQIGNTGRHNVVEVDYDGDGNYEYQKVFGTTVKGLSSSGLLPATNTGSILSGNVKIKISGTDGSVYPYKVIFYTTKKAKKSVTLEYSAAEWDGSNSQPTLTAKDEDGNNLTIGTDINVTYTTDDPNVAEVEDNGNVTIADAANGNAVITATSAENEIYNAASDHFVVKKQQGVTFAFSENSTKPSVREHIFLYGDETSEMGNVPADGKNVLLTGTFGGWNRNEGKYNPADLSDKTSSSYKADDWAAVAGAMNPVDGYEWASAVNRDAADEACNKESYYGKDRAGWFQPADIEDGRVVESYPFTLPVRGGYMTFEPTVNGTLTIYIDQNGAWDNDNGGKADFLGHFRKHAFFITDQNGVSVSNYTTFSTITKTPVTQGDENDKKFTCNLDANGNAADEDPYNIGNWDEFKNYFTRSERLAVKNAWNTGVNGAQQVIKLDNGSFLVTQRAAVKYTFYVSAGQTYYLFSNFSKMGFCAVNFVADTETGSQPTATLALKEKEPYVKPTLYETAGQENNVKNISVPQYQQISLDRTFTDGAWNTIYLPFVMTEKEVEDIFGTGTQLLLLNGAEVDDEGVLKLEFIYHEIQNILPGYPYLIKPAKNVSATDIKVSNKLLDPNVKEMKLAFGQYTAMGTEGFSKSGDTTNGIKNSNNSLYYSAKLSAGDIYVSGGKLYMASDKPVFSNGYRSYIKKTGGSSPAKAIRMSVIGGNFSEDGTATAIDIVELSDEAAETLGISKTVKGVYNLNGQKMTESVDRLPAGMYIVNGKKMYVK